MTPLHLELLVFFNTGAKQHPRCANSSVITAAMDLVEDGILLPSVPKAGQAPVAPGCYEITPKGRAWLQMILRTPYPRLVFVDSKGAVVEISMEPAPIMPFKLPDDFPPAPPAPVAPHFPEGSPCG